MAPRNTGVIVAGIGCTEYVRRREGATRLSMAVEACNRAIEDAGLDRKDIDGMMNYNLFMGDSTPPHDVALSLNLPGLRYWMEYPRGGGPGLGLLFATAVAVIHEGLARSILLFRSMLGGSGFRIGGGGRVAGTDGDLQFLVPFGQTDWADAMAFWARRHMGLYGTKPEHFGAIAVAASKYAAMNPRAQYRTELTLDDYFNGQMIVDPFRRRDLCVETDGACAVLLTSEELAKEIRPNPVYIRAVAVASDNRASAKDTDTASFLRLAETASSYGQFLAPLIYEKAGIGPKDVDVFLPYDQMTHTTMMAIEDFGFCAKGEGGPFVEAGEILPGGSMPTNTHGGLLAEAYMHNINHAYEAVDQLRGTAGERQIPNAELALVSNGHATMAGAVVFSASA
jgi:acetyl-CoA acetyltransferase